MSLAVVVFALALGGERASRRAQAQEGELPGMSLQVKRDCDDAAEITTVIADVPFVVCIITDPSPDIEIASFSTEVLFQDGLDWIQRPICEDEVLVTSAGSGQMICIPFVTPLLGGASHAVISAVQAPPLPALDVTPGSTTTLVELDFVCSLGGEQTLTLTASPETVYGSIYADIELRELRVRTIQHDYDGDTVPNEVADTATITCAGPTATPCPPDGCPTPTPRPNVNPTIPGLETIESGLVEEAAARDDDGAINVGVWAVFGLLAGAAVIVAAVGGWRRFARRQ